VFNWKTKKPILFKVTEPNSIPYRTHSVRQKSGVPGVSLDKKSLQFFRMVFSGGTYIFRTFSDLYSCFGTRISLEGRRRDCQLEIQVLIPAPIDLRSNLCQNSGFTSDVIVTLCVFLCTWEFGSVTLK
jgi:hypothetical protein